MSEKRTAAKVPCGSCPYRRDVPSGIWSRNEYEKLPDYDKPMWEQPKARFDCHQRDGNLCAGWLACHGNNLLSLRLGTRFFRSIDPAMENYHTDVPVFASGAEAAAHGIKGIKRPGKKARKMVAGLMKKQGVAT